ncbi:MAG: ATP-binding cassette domain-containing protein [Bacteroidota bacterium]
MIRLQGIGKRFGDHQVLEDIYATFGPGLVNMVIGASGSGKSVLMKIMVGLVIPDQGDLQYENESLASMDREAKQGLRQKHPNFFVSV